MTIQTFQQPMPAAYQQPPVPERRAQGLSFLVHGAAKAGKSTFADSGPGPRLIVDVEGTSYWTPSRKIYWNPDRETPPQLGRHVTVGYGPTSVTAAWESCIATVRDAGTVDRIYNTLNSGQHPWNAISVDSITEVQQRIIDSIAGTRKIERDQWGALLRQVSSTTRRFRDLITHPTHPIWSVCFVAGTHQRDGKWRPLVQGQVSDFLPYYVDVLGFIAAQPDGTRNMLIGPHPQYETGERVGGRLPYSLQLGYPGRPGYTIETCLKQVLTGGTPQ
jgi:hypothetical protein